MPFTFDFSFGLFENFQLLHIETFQDSSRKECGFFNGTLENIAADTLGF